MAASAARPNFRIPPSLDLMIDQYARSGDEELREVFRLLPWKRWRAAACMTSWPAAFIATRSTSAGSCPTSKRCRYDNSELLKNYVHAFQATGSEFFAAVARDIIRWMDEWLSDREHGGFYASQDADYSMDDDGDYFTWTLDGSQGSAERGGVWGRRRCTMTSTKSAKCTTIPRRMSCMCGLRSRKSRSG